MSNDSMSKKEKKEMVKAQLNELIRLKTEALSTENSMLREKTAQLERELEQLRSEGQEPVSEESLSRRAGMIIIDAQKTAQKIINDAKEKADSIARESEYRPPSLQPTAKAAERAVLRLKAASMTTEESLDESLKEIRDVIMSLESGISE